jgi:hypothetical protein
MDLSYCLDIMTFVERGCLDVHARAECNYVYRFSSHHLAISVRVLIHTFGMDLA